MFDATWFAAAAIAPLVAWALWRIQAVVVNQILRGGMYRLLRHQRRTYNVVSWFGVLLHELSHAIVLLLGGHGIRDFSVKVDEGHVTPKQVRKGGLGTLTFIAAALAPMVAAPAVILALVLLLLDPNLLPWSNNATGLTGATEVLQVTLVEAPQRWLSVLVGLDITTIAGGVIAAMAVLALPAARPSHVKKKGEPDEGDIAVVRRLIRRRPLPVIAFMLVVYASYFAIAAGQVAYYWIFWQTIWGVAVTGILFGLLAGLGWYAVAWTGRIQPWAAWLPYAAVVAVQYLGRQQHLELWWVNAASMGAFVLLAIGLRSLAGRRF